MRMILPLIMLAATSAARATVISDLACEQSSFMADDYYTFSDVLPFTNYDTNGAASAINISYDETGAPGVWRIEQQRFGRDFILYGIVHGDAPIKVGTNIAPSGSITPIEFGIMVLQWGLDQEQADGSFNCGDKFHSTAFFLEALSDACLALNASPDAPGYAHWTAMAALRAHLSAEWMLANQATFAANEQQFGHRYWLDGAAFQLTGVLTNDATLEKNATLYINNGYAAQLSNGVNPELGGFDTSYQAVGMMYACRLWEFLRNKTYANKVYTMLSRAEAWEDSMVYDNGVVSTEGNTRTGACQETSPTSGACKTVNYPAVFCSFYFWSTISRSQYYAEKAKLVVAGDQLVRGEQE